MEAQTNDQILSDGVSLSPYLATAIAEGFCEGEAYKDSLEDQMRAWAYLIRFGLIDSLQGWFGRTASALINASFISKTGVINWDAVEQAKTEG